MQTQENTGASALERRIDMAITKADIDKEVEQRLRRISKTVKMAGFRPGKVPAKVVRQRFRDQILWLRADLLPALPEGVYYHYQILGLQVVTDDGRALGTVAEILKTGANDVYVVRGEAGEILLPAIESVIRRVAPAEGTLTVHLIEGLLPPA